MARTNEYGQLCPIAQTLEVVGEKWSFLIVRDLLVGPQRFTDLLGSLSNITPKWLTQRLRNLEAAGIVERSQASGHREVWYRLTPKGRDLAPVLDALADWGVEYVLPLSFPDDKPVPAQASRRLVTYLNRRGVVLAEPTRWLIRLAGQRPHVIAFDGTHWSTSLLDDVSGISDSEDFPVIVGTTTETWSAFLLAWPDERAALLQAMSIRGGPKHVADFTRVSGWRLSHIRGELAAVATGDGTQQTSTPDGGLPNA
jgi:DNA-binding HxlR family transcriptional regulator